MAPASSQAAAGWFPQFQPDSEGQQKIGEMRELARAAGRDPGSIGIEGRVSLTQGGPDEWNKLAAAWDEAGATHLSMGRTGPVLSLPKGWGC